MTSDKSHESYDLMAHFSDSRPILLSCGRLEETENVSVRHLHETTGADKQLLNSKSDQDYNKALNTSTHNHKHTAFLSIPEVKQTRITMPHCFFNTGDAFQPSSNTAKPATRAAQEDRPCFSPEKQVVLNDLKKFAKEFKLGPQRRVSPAFNTPFDKPVTFHLKHTLPTTCFNRPGSSTPHSIVTPSASQTATFRAVLETSELLESIISYLSPKELLDAQRVSKQWKNVIVGSPSIQEKLFMRREDRAQEIWVMERRRDWSHPNIPVAALVEYGNVRDSPRRVTNLPPPDTLSLTPVVLNPMLQATECWVQSNGGIKRVNRKPYGAAVNYSAWANALRYNESCVRKMLLTDPPCDKAYIESLTIYFGNPESRHPTRSLVSLTAGIRSSILSTSE